MSRCGRRRLKQLIEEQQIQFQRPLRLGDRPLIMIRGGGDPNTAMALKPCPEWACRLGASPQKRIVASWSGSRMDPTEYKVAARASRPSVGSPRINYTEPRTTKDIELQ